MIENVKNTLVALEVLGVPKRLRDLENRRIPIGGRGGSSTTIADGTYLETSGGTLTGDVIFPATGFVMTDELGGQWRVTINSSGTLTTTAIAAEPFDFIDGTGFTFIDGTSFDLIN